MLDKVAFFKTYDICQGAENPTIEKSGVGVTGEAVLKMRSALPARRNHKVFCRQLLYICSPCLTRKREEFITLVESA